MNSADSLLNPDRPPAFCAGCSHQNVLIALDKAFKALELKGHQICMVSDIGCSGLFDTFFNTHAMHGLHGRALTYASGIKLVKPELNVVVTMGDGGLGIGGAHLLSACRRNLDITLLVLNNFNFGMTGGQYSATTPTEAIVGSEFLNSLERPLDPSAVAVSAGAPFVATRTAYDNNLIKTLENAIRHKGFSFVEIQGLCTGRYSRHNKLNPKILQENLEKRGGEDGEITANSRPEYGEAYRREAAAQKRVPFPSGVSKRFEPIIESRTEVMILGSAGMRIQTAGEILGLAGILAGIYVTQKSSYPITVLRGMSVTDLILSPKRIDYIGYYSPQIILALAHEGVTYRKAIFSTLDDTATIIKEASIEIPPTKAKVLSVDLNTKNIKRQDWALSALALMGEKNLILNSELLRAALEQKFRDHILEASLEIVKKALAKPKITI